MKVTAIRNILPPGFSTRLWGDRKRWGLKIDHNDSCWQEWQEQYLAFYQANQRAGIGTRINDAGYRIMSQLSLTDHVILEIGPGDVRHLAYWNTLPKDYILADIQQAMLNKATAKLQEKISAIKCLLIQRDKPLPLADASVDAILSFYSLEHIYPLSLYLQELERVLKPGGLMVGAIPTEGGFAWGCGRFLTARQWLKRNTGIDPDKIICWEHPNFADDILQKLDIVFDRKSIEYWPLPWLPHIDLNLIIRFIYKKKG